jgi:hypothetical protein
VAIAIRAAENDILERAASVLEIMNLNAASTVRSLKHRD